MLIAERVKLIEKAVEKIKEFDITYSHEEVHECVIDTLNLSRLFLKDLMLFNNCIEIDYQELREYSTTAEEIAGQIIFLQSECKRKNISFEDREIIEKSQNLLWFIHYFIDSIRFKKSEFFDKWMKERLIDRIFLNV